MLKWKGTREESAEWKDWYQEMVAQGRILYEDEHRVLTTDDEAEQQRIDGIRSKGDIFFGRTPLIVACRAGDCEQVRLLLESGADPTVPDRSGMTPLHEAAHMGQPEVMSLLLEFGVDVETLNPQPRYHATPIHQAAFSGNPKTVQVLYDHGADLNRRMVPAPNVPLGDSALLRAQRYLLRMQELRLDPTYNPEFEAAYARYVMERWGLFSPTVESCEEVVHLLIALGAVE